MIIFDLFEDNDKKPQTPLTVDQLATISDAALDSAYGYGRSSPGNTFGWQANLKSAAFAKQMIDRGVTDIEAISDAIHQGWNVTAQAFVKNPMQFDDSKTMAPEKLQAKLAQRQKLMTQQYAQLPEEEKEKDRVVARAMLQAITGGQQNKFDQYQQQRNTPAKDSAEYINRQANAKPGDPIPPPFQKGVTEGTNNDLPYDWYVECIDELIQNNRRMMSPSRLEIVAKAVQRDVARAAKEDQMPYRFSPSMFKRAYKEAVAFNRDMNEEQGVAEANFLGQPGGIPAEYNKAQGNVSDDRTKIKCPYCHTASPKLSFGRDGECPVCDNPLPAGLGQKSLAPKPVPGIGMAEGSLKEFVRSRDRREEGPGDDPYKRPKPEHYRRSIDFFGQFEADHFDEEDMNDATGEFRGYWDYDGQPKQIAYFKWDNPQRTGADDPGMGWYYEPQDDVLPEGKYDDQFINDEDAWYNMADFARKEMRQGQSMADVIRYLVDNNYLLPHEVGNFTKTLRGEKWNESVAEGKLNELFNPNSSYPIETKKIDFRDTEVSATTQDGRKITCLMRYDPRLQIKIMSIDFNVNGQVQLTGQGDATKILTTVVEAVKKQVAQIDPEYLIFLADSQHQGIYSAMARRLGGDYQRMKYRDAPAIFKYYTQGMDPNAVFILHNTTIEEQGVAEGNNDNKIYDHGYRDGLAGKPKNDKGYDGNAWASYRAGYLDGKQAAKSKQGVAESAGPDEYYIWTVHFANPEKNPPRRVRVYSDEFVEELEGIKKFYAKKGLTVVDVDTDVGIRSEPKIKPERYEVDEGEVTKTIKGPHGRLDVDTTAPGVTRVTQRDRLGAKTFGEPYKAGRHVGKETPQINRGASSLTNPVSSARRTYPRLDRDVDQLAQYSAEDSTNFRAYRVPELNRSLPGMSTAAQKTSQVMNLKQNKPYVKRLIPSPTGHLQVSVDSRMIGQQNGGALIKGNTIDTSGRKAFSKPWSILINSDGNIVTQDLSRLNDDELAAVEYNLVTRNRLLQPNQIAQAVAEARVLAEKQNNKQHKDAVKDPILSYQGVSHRVKGVLKRAYAENPGAKNDIEAIVGHIASVDDTNQDQQRQISMLTKKLIQAQDNYNQQEQRFQELTNRLRKQGGQPTPQDVQAAQAAGQIEQPVAAVAENRRKMSARKKLQRAVDREKQRAQQDRTGLTGLDYDQVQRQLKDISNRLEPKKVDEVAGYLAQEPKPLTYAQRIRRLVAQYQSKPAMLGTLAREKGADSDEQVAFDYIRTGKLRPEPSEQSVNVNWNDVVRGIPTQPTLGGQDLLNAAASELKKMGYGTTAETRDLLNSVLNAAPEMHQQLQAAYDRKVAKSRDLAEDQDTEQLERAIMHRIMVGRKDLLLKHSPQRVMEAVETVASNSHNDNTDVNGCVHRVEQILDDVSEAKAVKTRLDPKCWTGKKIGNPKTKVKNGVRVNNCVPK